ncbi:hypothetical protein [Desulfobacter latus]|uniref:Uncharacterized protein n=1 Tax=Desulfobacter latus TaxID=2292 RepID=A0A850T229_9BACT|nr:hypothetical protein [Desulfobacter latus]NWH06410.1 hypothetical protein [Desulfobacter latus]
MRKTIITIVAFFAILVFSNSAYAAAATWAQSGAGKQVTIGSDASTQLAYDPSPGVLIEGASDIAVYCILTGNSKAGADAMVYAVASATGDVGQDPVDLSGTSPDLGTPTTNGTIPSGFTSK